MCHYSKGRDREGWAPQSLQSEKNFILPQKVPLQYSSAGRGGKKVCHFKERAYPSPAVFSALLLLCATSERRTKRNSDEKRRGKVITLFFGEVEQKKREKNWDSGAFRGWTLKT